MRGLAFPTDPQADRETSNECGSPSNATDDIPIDPALNAIPLDPSLMEEAKEEQGEEEAVPPHEDIQEDPTPRKHTYYAYSQVPEGDPALFQQQELFPPAPHPEEPAPMTRRVRGPKRRKRCSFCHGNDQKNKYGVPESMVGCSECGRVGHPSCLQLADVAEILHSYAWVCIECKKCEFCHEKGADDRLMFCDRCDRGYHMDCFDPPIAEMPTGKWYCPGCERDYPQECVHPEQEVPQPVEQPEQPSVQDLFSSPAQSTSELPVASTSQLPPPSPAKRSHKRKHRVVSSDEEEVDVESTTLPKRKSRLSAKMAASVASTTEQRGKLKASASQISINDESRSHKRRRVAAPSSPQPLRIRLPPQRNKGKERAHFQDDDIDVEGDGEEDEEQKGMFDDILTPEERDTSKTEITPEDTRRFEAARARAEARLASSATAQPPEWDTGQSHQHQQQPEAGPSGLRPRIHPRLTQTQPVASSPAPVEAQPPGVGQRIQCIRFGPYDIKTWYDAPFPEEYSNIPDGRLWLCEFCLKYMKSRLTAGRHKLKCKARHPPGDEIYRDGAVSIFEVDGRRNKIYCQNLCLLSKMFLDHKSLFYDVEPFLFYVMTEVDEVGARFVGYFSKEKRSHKDYNLSCIMTLPVRQRQGFGNLLIDFSYLLSKREQRLGSPEKPLSGLGALGYRNYWKLAVHRYLATAPDNPRLEDISAATSMTIEDVYNTLKLLDYIDVRPSTPPSVRPSPGQAIKFPKGRKHGASRRPLQRGLTNTSHSTPPPPPQPSDEPFVPPKHYDIHWDQQQVEEYLAKWEAKGYITLKPEKLKWSPFIVMRTRKTEAAEAAETADLVTTNRLEGRGMSTPGRAEGESAVPRVDDALLHLFDDEADSRERNCRDAANGGVGGGSPGPPNVTEPDKTPSKRRRARSGRRVQDEDGDEDEPRPRDRAHSQDVFESDEQLAARLAQEEQRTAHKRSLRSRSEVDDHTRHPSMPSPVKRTSSQKSERRRKTRRGSASRVNEGTPNRNSNNWHNIRNVNGRFVRKDRIRREPSPESASDAASVENDDDEADVAHALMSTSVAPSSRETTSPRAVQTNGDSSGAPTVTADSCSASAHTPPPVLAPLTPSPEEASRSPGPGADSHACAGLGDAVSVRKAGKTRSSLPPVHVNGVRDSGKLRGRSAGFPSVQGINGAVEGHERRSPENEEDAEGESDDDL